MSQSGLQYIDADHSSAVDRHKNLNNNYRKEREHHFIRKFNTYYKGNIDILYSNLIILKVPFREN